LLLSNKNSEEFLFVNKWLRPFFVLIL
jgi:hypothetical protein